MEITSIENEKVKFWVKLKEKKYSDINKEFLVEDDHLVSEAIKKNIVKEIITIDKTMTFEYKTYYVNDKIMKKISNQVTYPKVMAVCSYIEEKNINGNIVALDNIQDPGNLGTIIRSAVAFNIDTIVLGDNTVDIYNPKVIRASEGMIFNINIIRTNLYNFLSNLDSDYLKITTNVNNGKNIKNIKFNKCVIVIGNEGNGVSKEIDSLCDEKVYINMNNNCESLNAGVSASILMYEVNNG